MRIFITGGTGFIGGHLVEKLLQEGHQLTLLSRSGGKSSRTGVDYLKGDPTVSGEWQEAAADHDAVINLAGASLFRPWTEKNKRLIRDSRILTTANLSDALSRKKVRASVLISASAIGYYGDRGNDELHENDPPGSDYLARLAVDWEKQAEKCSSAGIRVIRCRFGIVFGPDGGALEKMVPVFKLGLGAPLGPGNQWFSWIHIDDLTGILSFLLTDEQLSGAVNCTAPEPVTIRQLTKTLAETLNRPAFLPAVPSFVLKTVLGNNAQMLLNSHKVLPGVLLDKGFAFSYPDIRSALKQILD